MVGSRELGRDRIFEKQHGYREVTHLFKTLGMTPSVIMMRACEKSERRSKLSVIRFLFIVLRNEASLVQLGSSKNRMIEPL